MLEAIRHICGFCGDGHPSLIYMLGLTPFFVWFRNSLRVYYKLTISGVKSFLKRFQ